MSTPVTTTTADPVTTPTDSTSTDFSSGLIDASQPEYKADALFKPCQPLSDSICTDTYGEDYCCMRMKIVSIANNLNEVQQKQVDDFQ